jgi:hypothetical protein
VNTIVIVACDDRGQIATNTMVIPTLSTARLYPRKLYR